MKINRFQKFFIYFMIISLIGISVATNSISDESKDSNQIKYLSYSSLPYYMELNNSTNKLDSNNLIPSKEFGNQTHPAIASNNTSYLLAFNDADYGNIFWGTFNDSVSFDINGGTYPSIKHQNNSTYYGTFVANPQQDSGAYIPVFKTTNPENFNTYEMILWNWEEYGWYNFTDVEIACDPSGDDPYFGFISLVGSTTYYGEGVTNAPHIFYYLGPDSGMLSWLVQYDNCSHTDACIDHQTKHAYAIYDHFNGNDWDLVLRKDNFGNNMSSIGDYIINGTGNLTYPKISVQNDQMVIVCETDREDNKDIIGIYNTPNDPQQVLIADSDADERFPEIERIDDSTYICSFISENTLYYSFSSNGGQTWSNPIKIKEHVIEAYKSIDLSEDLDYMGCEVINGSDSDVEFDDLRQSIVFVDDDYDNSTPGWQYDHFDVIQDGIDAVAEGGTVYVYNGIYYENVVVNKTIDLIGEDMNNTIVDGAGSGRVVKVTASSVYVTDFTIQNGFYSGIVLYSSSNNTITGNNISKNNWYGIRFYYSSNNTITGNNISNNMDDGIILQYSSNNTIIGNNISNNGDGIFLRESIDNTITGNNISNNNNDGICFYDSSSNAIYHNNFLDNYQNAKDDGNNLWDNGYPSGGNYWDNYTGTDADGDGIGDKPYNISGGSNQDMYPLGYFHPIANFTYQPSNPIMLSRVYFTDTSFDPDGSITSWFWDFGEGDTSTEQHPSNIFVNEGNYTVCLTVTDNDGKNHTYCQIINVSSGLDVNQTLFDRGFPIRHAVDGDWAAAQSFTPTIDTLTRVEIILRKFGTPEFNLTVELRTDHPQGTLIDSKSYVPDQVSSSWEMFEVNFNDTAVQNDTDYFIVIPPAPSGVTTSFGYEWGYAFGDQYPDGAFWFTRDGGGLWRDLPTMYEFAFRTYGYS